MASTPPPTPLHTHTHTHTHTLLRPRVKLVLPNFLFLFFFSNLGWPAGVYGADSSLSYARFHVGKREATALFF